MKNNQNNTLRSWLVVFTAGAFFFYSFIQMTLFSTEAMKMYFMETLNLSTTVEFGNFAGTFLYGTVLLLLPMGLVLDKFSVKKVIVFMITVVIVCVIGLTFTTNLYVAMSLRFIDGIAHCVAFMAPFRLAPRWFPSNKLALVSGLLVAFAVFGGWVSGTPLLAILETFGGKTAMLLNAGLGVIILIAAIIFIKDFSEGEEEKDNLKESLSLSDGLRIAIKNRQNWLSGLFIGLLNLSVLLLGAVWGTTYLKIVNPEFTEATFTGIIGMIFIGTIIGSPIAGLISDKLNSRKKVMLGGGVLSLIVMMLIIFPPSNSAGLFYALFLMLGLLTSTQSIGYPVIAESNGDNVLGTANGLSSVVLMGIGALGQPLFGKLVEQFGGGVGATQGEVQEAFQSAIWMMPIGFIGAIVCALLLRETFKR